MELKFDGCGFTPIGISTRRDVSVSLCEITWIPKNSNFQISIPPGQFWIFICDSAVIFRNYWNSGIVIPIWGRGIGIPNFFIPNQALALQAKIEAEPISAQEAMAEAKHRAELAANDMLQPALHKSAVCQRYVRAE